MKTGRGIGLGLLLAALGAGTAGADGHFGGRVLDGAPDYSDEAFGRMEQALAKANGWTNEADAKAFGEALAAVMKSSSGTRDDSVASTAIPIAGKI